MLLAPLPIKHSIKTMVSKKNLGIHTVVPFFRYGNRVEALDPDKIAGYADVKRYIVLMQLITVYWAHLASSADHTEETYKARQIGGIHQTID